MREDKGVAPLATREQLADPPRLLSYLWDCLRPRFPSPASFTPLVWYGEHFPINFLHTSVLEPSIQEPKMQQKAT